MPWKFELRRPLPLKEESRYEHQNRQHPPEAPPQTLSQAILPDQKLLMVMMMMMMLVVVVAVLIGERKFQQAGKIGGGIREEFPGAFE